MNKLKSEDVVKVIENCIKAKTAGDCNKLRCPANTKDGCIYACSSEQEDDFIREILKDVLAILRGKDERIFQLENRLKECENGYEGTLFLDRCKLHDADEKVKELTEENKRVRADTVKKFAKRLRGEVSDQPQFGKFAIETPFAIFERTIDQIAKEMLEGK